MGIVQTPQATPKHMTDEELRQQYGIQLASRPIDSGDGKEAKWADIDDDEDDWAPETIEWNDGTKINLAQVDTATPIVPEQLTAVESSQQLQEQPESEPTATTPTKMTTLVGPKPTVLKLGASASSQPKPPPPIDSPQLQQSLTKSFNDKPTLVAKPSPAPPPKNPWATLPPVDKYAPVTPPVLPPQARYGRDSFFSESMPPPPPPHAQTQMPAQPAKEIAADDFSRFTRDGTSGTPRELFNSQSGRYEPVAADGRRASRKDQGFRAPAVLQRPSASDIHGPAEPSPAFQTTRSQQQDATQWRRRRASSNISGDNSSTFARRMSMTTTGKDTNTGQRRDSQLEQPLTPSVSSATKSVASPVISHAQSIMSQSPVVGTVQAIPSEYQQSSIPQMPPPFPHPPGTTATPFGHTNPEDVKIQKNLMKEKAEAAHKRRIEEEQREEAEKRERLKVKMEQLGLTGEKTSKKAAKEEVVEPSLPELVSKDVNDSPANQPQMPAAAAKAASPPKPPVPTANGAPQQYGLMKVHPPQIVSPTTTTMGERKPVNVPSDVVRDTNQDAKGQPAKKELVAQVNGDHQAHSNKRRELGASNESDEKSMVDHLPRRGLTPVGPPPSSANTGYQGWPQHSMATHSAPGGNVWAAPAHHKGLGNGDFQKRAQVTPAQQQQSTPQQPYPQPPPLQQQHLVSPQPQPPPIGTPRQTTIAYSNNVRPPLSEPPIVSLPRHVDAITPQPVTKFGSDPNVIASTNHLSRTHTTATTDQSIIKPVPALGAMATQRTEQPPPRGGMAIWNDFANNATAYDTKAREKIAEENAVALAEQQKTGKPLPAGPTFNETWNKVVKGESLGARQLVESVKTQRDSILAETTPAVATQPIRSRFQDIFDQTDRPLQNRQAVSIQPDLLSSPPPEIEFHPVFGLAQRPVVNLPGSKVRNFDHPEEGEEQASEKPIVRLPPPKTSSVLGGTPVVVDSKSTLLSPMRAQPFVANPTWQDRINGLFDRKIALEERKSLDSTGFSESKPSYSELLPVGSTYVSLPPSTIHSTVQPILFQKNVEEEDALFEERDFGSVPTVRVPAMAPPPAWNPAKPYSNRQRMLRMILPDTAILSCANFIPGVDDLTRQGDIPVIIKLGGMTTPKTKSLNRPGNPKQARQSHTNTRGKSRSHAHPKGRDQSAPLASSTPGQLNTGRQNARHQSGTQRKPSGNISHQTWAGRVSGLPV